MNWQDSSRDDFAEHLLKYLDEAKDQAMLVRLVDICAEMLRRKDEADEADTPEERRTALHYAVRALFDLVTYFDIGGVLSEHYNGAVTPPDANFRVDPERRRAEILARFMLDIRDAFPP